MSIFTKQSFKGPNYSLHDLNHTAIFSADMGYLIPTICKPVLPNESISLSSSQMVRMMPLIAPTMHEVNITMHYFFVPNRIIWKKFKKFIESVGDPDNAPLFPTVSALEVQANSLADYLGLPLTGEAENIPQKISILPFLAYNMIWNEFYRDQNLQEEIDYETWEDFEGDKLSADYPDYLFKLRKRAWNHDYFTSALPFAQKGVDVMLPLFNSDIDAVPIDFNPNGLTAQKAYDFNTKLPFAQGRDLITDGGGHTRMYDENDNQVNVTFDNSDFLEVDIDAITASAASIRDLRTAIALQAFYEKNARGGTRYIEQLMVHWGARVPDSKLQRPEFLGGSVSPIMISEVLQQSQTTSTSPQGNMAGHGMNLGNTKRISKKFDEHGYVIGLMSIRPKTMYFQGIPKDFTKTDVLDFGYPAFEHIGEQTIKNQELLWNHPEPDGIFGYIPRYSEYKYIPNRVSGELRKTLKFWHLAREFDVENPPALNSDFIECTPRTDIFAVQAEEYPRFIISQFHNIKSRLPFSYYSNPKLL